MKVFIVDGGGQYELMFKDMGFTVVDSVGEADLVQFTGGADVNPHLYGHTQHPTSYIDPSRDLLESQYYEMCKRAGKPMAGICRGGQFLNVCNGGSLVQHMDGHAAGCSHGIVDIATGGPVTVSSTHHQMMVPHSKGEVLAIASEASYKECHIKGEVVDSQSTHKDDVEVVFYKDTKCLCFQPHPEFSKQEDCRAYYFSLLKRLLGVSA